MTLLTTTLAATRWGSRTSTLERVLRTITSDRSRRNCSGFLAALGRAVFRYEFDRAYL